MKAQRGGVKIRISQLSNGIHKYHFTPPASEIGLDSRFPKNVTVDATLDKNGGQMVLSAEVAASALFECDRCIGEFKREIAGRYKAAYVTEKGGDARGENEEPRALPPDAYEIDLTSDIREVLMLSVPIKLLCKENCRGLCPHCGVNLNERTCSCKVEITDTRWESLRKLYER